MSKNYLKTSILSFIFSLFSLIGFIISLSFTTNSSELNIVNILKLNQIDYPLLSLILFFLLGTLSFLIGVSDMTSYFLEKKHIQNYLLKSIIFTFIFLTLPFYVIFHMFFTCLKLLVTRQLFLNLKAKIIFRKFLLVSFIFLFLLPSFIFAYLSVGLLSTRLILQTLGYAPVTEYVAGTGSMYPTFPKGDKVKPIDQFNQIVAAPSFISYPSGVVIFDKRYFGRNLQRGDIVSFFNQKTAEITQKEYGVKAGFIKRIIALSGDTIELRGGIVYLNKKPLKEPYTAKPQSTFGENFLSECHSITVPKNHIFVMGDNRKGSGDSREIGFINEKDIDRVLPIENQKDSWDKNWRDTSKDFDISSKIKLDVNEYLRLLNEKRAEANAKPLSYEPKLTLSAKTRGEVIIKFNDFSFNATRSGLTMQKAMQQEGYSNITYGEAPTHGYFEASELIENQFQFPDTKQFLLDKDYEDFGVSEVEGNINNCPTQVIVQHFAGYIPPDYSLELIKSWEDALDSLNGVAKGWKDLRDIPNAYNKDKADIDRIIEIINRRQTMITAILDKMHKNLWLSNEENSYTKTEDKALGEEQLNLAKKINDLLNN